MFMKQMDVLLEMEQLKKLLNKIVSKHLHKNHLKKIVEYNIM